MAIETISDELVFVNLPLEAAKIDKELNKLNELIGTHPKCDVVIDFTKVEIIVSSSISNLLILHSLLQEHDHNLILCNLNVPTKCIFTVAGLNEVFTFASNRTDALALACANA